MRFQYLDVREDVLVRVEILLLLDRWRKGSRRAAAVAVAAFGGDVLERQYVGVDHAELGLRAQLAAQETRGFQIAIDILGAAGNEAGDEDALKRRDVQLGPDWRLDRDLERVRAGRRQQHRGDTAEQPNASCDH